MSESTFRRRIRRRRIEQTLNTLPLDRKVQVIAHARDLAAERGETDPAWEAMLDELEEAIARDERAERIHQAILRDI